jgi:hypothetical protein
MPWQNCHGYLLLLLILLIVVLIIAAQLLWQYFVPSNLVAALDHKRHLPPNTNTLPLNMVTIAQTKWKPGFSVIYKKYSSFNYDFLLKYIFGRH